MASTKIISEMYWETIVETIYNGNCVPFLGAGVNLKCFDGEGGLPLGGEVALRLVESMIKSSETEKHADLKSAIETLPVKKYRERISTALQDLTKLGPPAELKLIEARLREMLHSITPDDQNNVTLKNLEALIGTLSSLENLLPPTEVKEDKDRFKKTLDDILHDDEKETRLAHIIVNDSLVEHTDLTRVALLDLARVSLRYRSYKSLQEFVAKLKELIPDTKCKPTRLLQTLAGMPLQLIITTNYDRLMERALELFSKDNIREPLELTARIKDDPSPVSECLHRLLSPEMRQWVEHRDEAQPNLCLLPSAWADELLPAHWADELNRIMQEHSVYRLEDEDSALSEDGLADKAWKAVFRQRPEDKGRVRLNRLLIEKSYPGIIKPLERPYEVMVQPIESVKGTAENENRKMLSLHDGVILYKLHGTFTDARPVKETRPVITEEDYIEFLTYVGGKGVGIDNQITEKLKDSTLLFLGYSLEDWNFRALFKGLVEKVNRIERPMSFAIQKQPSNFWVNFWEDKNVIIFDVDLCAFALELEKRYQKFKKTKESESAREAAREAAEWEEAMREAGRARRKKKDAEEGGQ